MTSVFAGEHRLVYNLREVAPFGIIRNQGQLPRQPVFASVFVNLVLHAYSVGSGGLLLCYDFVDLIEDAFVPGKVERLVSNFKQMQDMILLIPLDELKRRKIVPPHIFSCDAYLKIGDIIELPGFHLYTSIQLSQSPDNSAFSISST